MVVANIDELSSVFFDAATEAFIKDYSKSIQPLLSKWLGFEWSPKIKRAIEDDLESFMSSVNRDLDYRYNVEQDYRYGIRPYLIGKWKEEAKMCDKSCDLLKTGDTVELKADYDGCYVNMILGRQYELGAQSSKDPEKWLVKNDSGSSMEYPTKVFKKVTPKGLQIGDRCQLRDATGPAMFVCSVSKEPSGNTIYTKHYNSISGVFADTVHKEQNLKKLVG